jgi:SAM-dependent methyltransferase
MAERRGPDRWFFDIWSRFYDAPLVQRLTYRPEHDAVLRGLRGAGSGQVLDVACGTGLFSRGMLAQAAQQRRADALVQGSALALPLAPGRFDAVVSIEAFHWFPDQAQALDEFFRVLAPGGRLLVSLVNPPLAVMGSVAHRVSRLVGEPARWPTRGQMRELFEAAGFRVESQQLVFRVPATLILPSVLTVGSRPR